MLLKTVLARVPFFCVVACSLFLSGCGDLGEDPILSDAYFSRTFRYYYEQECEFDDYGIDERRCGRVRPLSPAYVVRIRIDGFGDASLNMDGTELRYRDGSYTERWDAFYFYEDDEELTVYKDGSEIIFWDLEYGIATIYSYEMY